MSIIYDALKKVESGLKIENKKIINSSSIFIYLGIAVAGFLAAQLLFNFFTPVAPSPKLKVNVTALKTAAVQHAQQQPLPKQQLLPKTQPEQTLPQPQQPAAKETNNLPEQPVAMPSLVLNGIFFTGNDGYCLINNQILKAGDEIQGAVVEKITEQEVELSNKGTTIKLSLGATQ